MLLIIASALFAYKSFQPQIPKPPAAGKDYIIIEKTNNKLYLYKDGKFVKSYRVATGKEPHFTQRALSKSPTNLISLLKKCLADLAPGGWVWQSLSTKISKSRTIVHPGEKNTAFTAQMSLHPSANMHQAAASGCATATWKNCTTRSKSAQKLKSGLNKNGSCCRMWGFHRKTAAV